jgi:hypothetical protein
MSNNDRTVSKRPDGKWQNKRDSAERPASIHETRKEAAKLLTGCSKMQVEAS